MLYSEPVKGQWLIAHQLYETAVQYKYHLTNINHIQGVQHPLANITQAYAQLILLDIFNTNQIRQSEIQALFQCSFDWARMIQILPKDTASTKYVVDPTKDHPPVYNKNKARISTQVFLLARKLCLSMSLPPCIKCSIYV